jgi:hypothetical protein
MRRLLFGPIVLWLVVRCAHVRPVMTGRWPAVLQPSGNTRGRISDAGVVQSMLKRFNVPGVSIAIIKDFRIVWTGA